MGKLKEKRGITLIALVITIVIIIILSMVAISMVMGDNGLIKQAEKGKNMTEKEHAREKLEMVLAGAYADKKINKDKYNEKEYLDNYIYENEPKAEILGEDEISYGGYTFELDRSVPQLGKYIGETGNLPARIKQVKITNMTFSEVSIEVLTARAEGAKYKYSYKEENGAYGSAEEKTENKYTLSNLDSNKSYVIKVELVKNNEVLDTKEISIRLGGLQEGELTLTDVQWNNGKASVKVTTTRTEQIQYQIDKISGSWTTIGNNERIQNISNGQTVYARLYDGKNGSEYVSLTIKDEVGPVISKIEIDSINETTAKIIVTASDEESGLATSETYKYYLNNESKGTSTNNNYEYTQLKANEANEIKVEVKDRVGNVTTEVKKIKTVNTKVTVNGDTSNGVVKLDSTNMKEYIGKTITNYKTPGETESVTVQTANWDNIKTFTVSKTYRLYYVDFEDNKYDEGTGTIYLKADATNNNYTFSNGKTVNKSIIQKYNPELYKNGVTPPNENNQNMKAVTWLLDPTEWNGLKISGNSTGIGNKVKEVVGAPSVEMFMDSYNAKYSLTGNEPVATGDRTADSQRTKLFYKYTSGAAGYQVGPGSSNAWENSTGNYTVLSDRKIDPMYYPGERRTLLVGLAFKRMGI